MAKVEVPLIRTRDRKPVGTLRLIRTMHTAFADRDSQHAAVPKPADTLIIYVLSATGEKVCVLTVPMADLDGPLVVEPVDAATVTAEIAELLDR